MRKTADYAFEYEGSTMHLRVWEGQEGQDRPVVVVEPGRGVPFEHNRVEIAKELAAATNTTPENLQWYEQSADGAMKQVSFRPYEVEHRPYANDMSMTDYREAEKQGHLKPDIIKGYHAADAAVSPEQKQAVEARVGERIESYEQRQNQEFQQFTFSHDRDH